MKRKLQRVYWRGILVTLAMAVAAIGVVIRVEIDDTRENLGAVLYAASLWTLDSNADLQQMADSIASVSPSLRVTFLMDTGIVLADSDPDADPSANDYDAPEIVAARNGQVGRSLRATTSNADLVLYMARRVSPQLILRVSYRVLEIAETLALYGASLLVLFLVLYHLQRRSISSFANSQVRQIEGIRRLLDGEVEHVEAVYPELQPTLDAIAYRVERVREDRREIMQTLNLRQDFVANASHELRSPLTSVRGFAEMLQEGMADTPEERALCVQTICSECDRMLEVIEDILRLSKAERAVERPDTPTAAGSVAREVCRALSPQAAQKGVALAVEGEADLWVPERDLWEILYNLVDNAVRYGRENGHVRVRLSGGMLTVEDDGIGIDRAHLPRIFEQFYRVDDAREGAAKGTGLGLAIVKAIVERCGGSIRAESELGAGSRFIMEFSSEDAG